MDLLIELLTELAKLSGPALWIGGIAIIGLFIYKIIIIGSIFGVTKFCTQKLHDVLTTERPPTRVITEWKCTDYVLSGAEPEFKRLAQRLDSYRNNHYQYIRTDDMTKLHEALDLYEEKAEKTKKEADKKRKDRQAAKEAELSDKATYG
jgi:hypothetical protein